MDSPIIKILKDHRADGVLFSHVSLLYPRDKFYIEREGIDKFWDTYCNEIFNKNPLFGIAEKSQHYLPILVDIDIKVKPKDWNPNGDKDKIYTKDNVKEVIQIYQSIIRKILNNCNDDNLICLVLEKPWYTDDKGFVKNGFHLHFPFTFMNKMDQDLYLIPQVKKEIKEMDTFKNIGIKDSSTLVDKSYTKVPWLLYGSRKNHKQQPYKVTVCFDGDLEKISLNDVLSNCNIYNREEELINFTKSPQYYLPRILSVIPFGRPVCEVKQNLKSINFHPVIEKSEYKYNSKSVENNLYVAKHLVPILSDYRSDDRNEWLLIGWILFNIGNGSGEALNIWLDFSSRCEDKYDENYCKSEWNKMIKKDLTLGTLKYLAKKDNPQEYEKFVTENTKTYISNSLNGSHNDIAKAMYSLYGDEFICSSTTFRTWYQFKNHRWKQIEGGVNLRSRISDEISYYYTELGKELFDKLGSTNDEGEKAMYNARIKLVTQLLNKLKSAPYKNNIMVEAMEVFRNTRFAKKLDSNPYLIGFKNGIYDLKANKFRDGRPEDYISMKMSVKYDIEMTEKDPRILEVNDFLEKIFPDRSVREYFMDTCSDIFVGGNPNKIVQFWSGEGDNGKSITQNIFEKMLGKYAIKLPTSLITGKRTQSSAACPELARAGGGVRWAVLQEPDQKDVINIGILKELSGNDTFYARTLHKEGSEINPMFKLILICNKPPCLPYSDKATWNRIRVIPFESTFTYDCPDTYEEQLRQKRFPVDPYFSDKIPNLVQAFAWLLLENRKKKQRRVEPDKVKMATANYRKRNDIYRQFIEEFIVEDKDSYLSLSELYSQFKEWYKDSLPNHSIPVKNEVKEYFLKIWGDFVKSSVWKGFKIQTIQEEIGDDGGAIVLDDEDLINYSAPPL